MNKLQQIVAYYCINYPHMNELSKARLTKLVYLADWFCSLSEGRQLTNIEWLFNHYGPYVEDVVLSAESSPLFCIDRSNNIYGSSKSVITYIGDANKIELTGKEKAILNLVISKTKDLFFNDFIEYVYSTYPVSSNERYTALNLVELAKEYKNSESAIFQ